MSKSVKFKRLPISTKGKLYFGALLSDETLKELKNIGVENIWNLMAELPTVAEAENKIFKNVIELKIVDCSIPSDKQEYLNRVDSIIYLLKNGENVYLHCFGGHGRTGMAISSILILVERLPIEAALKMAKSLCNGPEFEEQKNFIRNAHLKIKK
jgi:protein-tyrosine phosphatase